MGLPEKLKAAREARGWSIEEVGCQLKLPARVIARVEAGDFDALGAPIYRRGYLRSFARLVDIPAEDVEVDLQQERSEPEPSLIATGVKPRGEYMFEQFLRPATYIALTALIALPVVWWAASGRLGQELAGSGRFDLQPPPLQQSTTTLAGAERSGTQALPLADHPPQTEIVRASMMSMPQPLGMGSVRDESSDQHGTDADVSTTEQITADSDAIGSGANEAILKLVDDSWVEVEANGKRIQQALLTAGQWRFRSEGTLSFKIGNSNEATLTADGEPVDLASHRSQNGVARIELFSSDSNDG